MLRNLLKVKVNNNLVESVHKGLKTVIKGKSLKGSWCCLWDPEQECWVEQATPAVIRLEPEPDWIY